MLLGTLLCGTPALAADPASVYEIEPNDTPGQATELRAPVSIIGALQGNDQDGYKWVVSDVDASKRWTLELRGIPGRLTVVDVLRVEYADNGVDVAGVEKLFTIGSRDGTRPGLAENLLFEPGEYILGVAHSGDSGTFRPPTDSISFGDAGDDEGGDRAEPGGYRLYIRAGEHMPVASNPVENTSLAKARQLGLGTQFAAFTAGKDSWFKVVANDNDASRYWDFSGQVPVGRQGDVFLRNASGEQLALAHIDRFGKFAFRDLGLSAGEYYVELKGKEGDTVRFFRSAQVGQVAEGREAEPNGSWNQANRLRAGAVEGRLAAPGDTDLFKLQVDEALADRVNQLRLASSGDQRATLCLLDSRGQRLQCRGGTGEVLLPDLVLAEGEWGVSVSGGLDADYTLTVSEQGPIEPGVETEPNDTVEYATSLPTNNRIKGRLVGNDTDFFRIVVPREGQLWRIQAMGEKVGTLRFHDGSGIQDQQLAPAAGQRRLRMDNVFLLPGEHYISLNGQDTGDYTLLARPMGRPDPNGELEPNDDVSRAQRLAFGQTRTGLLMDGDKDNYRFHLANWDRIRLTVTPPPDGKYQVNTYWDTVTYRKSTRAETGQPVVMEGLFQPGDFRLELIPVTPGEGEYTVSLERLPRFGCPSDCEPNDNPAFARPLPKTGIVEGDVGEWGDWDWYELPVFEQETAVRVIPAERSFVEVETQVYGKNLVGWNQTEMAFLGTLPAGHTSYLVVRPGGPTKYRLELRFDGEAASAGPAVPLPVKPQLDLQTETVSGYRAYGQLVNGSIRLTNNGPETLNLSLRTATSDRRWQVRTGQAEVVVAPGGSGQVPLQVLVPDDAWADRPVRISVAAYTQDGRHVETFREIAVDGEAPAVNPRRYWDLPDELRGGFNVAAQNLGGQWLGEDDDAIGRGFQKVFDGVAVDGDGLLLRGGYRGPEAEIAFELAGGNPVEIAGLVVSLLSSSAPQQFLNQIDFLLSLDGVDFKPALKRKLDPIKAEQAILLDHAVMARFGKLMIGDDFTGRPRSMTTLGEVKVIAKPGFDLSAGRGFNLAAPELGGHVVWSNPQVGQVREREFLSEKVDHAAIALKPGQPLEWVVGFHHDRAAKIARLEWDYPPDPLRFQKIEKVLVSLSLDSPVGPWEPLGEWALDPATNEHEWLLVEPVWARFLRFSATGPESGGTVMTPETLRVWEIPTSGDYRSILTEWGDASQAAIYEAVQDLETEPPVQVSGNTTREEAAELQPAQRVAGTVRLGETVNWYRVSVPAEHNTLIMKMGGESTVRTVVRLEDEAGEAVPTRIREADSSPSLQTIEAVVEPGSAAYVEVSEPPRNVAFLWDTSPSVGSYVPIIYNAMITYAGDLVPGRDAANFAPYGRGVLLRDWYGEPYILQTVLNEYPRQESSSAAEYTMELASRALARRPGAKAIVNVTDAATGQYPPAWEQFASVKPRIFNLGVSSAGNLGRDPAAEQDLMQDWSRVNGGYYQYMLSQGEMEVAFDRAATMLRRPADYTLEASSEFREAPGPGTLRIVAAQGGSTATAGSGGVELILDASGSMLKRLDGKRRIAIAREVLSDTVRELIPAGTPVALRVFGHKEANACRTDLEIPLAPLDPEATVKVIEKVNAMNLAKTPIAASLAAAEQDLGTGGGRKVIVLLTDGEETCDGDPEAVIKALQEKGLDISLNIVGFAIDDQDLERQFESWSQAGNGRYFSARDQSGLSESISQALQTPFTVYDRSGKEIASGVVGGEPVELEAGFYRVVVAGSPPQIFDDVEVPGEEGVVVEIRP